MKPVLLILFIIILGYFTMRESFTLRKTKRRWRRRFIRNRWKNKRLYDAYRRKYINYYPRLYHNLNHRCYWIKVCDNGYYYYY